MGWPKSRELGLTVKNRPRNPSSIEKGENDPEMSHRQTPWYTGAKFFKRVLKNFEKEEYRLPRSYHSPVQGRQKKKSGIPHRHTSLYTGAKFFYLQEARKIYSTLHTGANFSIFVGKNRKNSKSHPNGPREGVRPKKIVEMGLVKE